jgi:benzoate membrane transport protein
MALAISMGVCGIFLSARSRMPISIAWSTPGAALLAASGPPDGGFATVVGAFIVSGALIVVSGLWRPLGRWVASIPAPLANAMLAGVLLPLCLAPVTAVEQFPVAGLVIVVAWAVTGKINKLFAMPVAVAVAAVAIVALSDFSVGAMGSIRPSPVFVVPAFSFSAVIGITLPLFVVTMASQNIPGMSVLNANGYRPDPGPLFSWTGGFTLLAAPFGGHAVNLAAITAALCSGDEAHPDRNRRYWAAIAAGIVYIVLGLGAGAATAFIDASPPILIEAVAGLALLGALGASMTAAVSEPRDRTAAVITFLVTASGVSFFGISGAFWGLIAGGGMFALERWRATG